MPTHSAPYELNLVLPLASDVQLAAQRALCPPRERLGGRCRLNGALCAAWRRRAVQRTVLAADDGQGAAHG